MVPIVTIKFLLFTWLIDEQSLRILYYAPIMVYNSEKECVQGLQRTREAHERSYLYNIKIRGVCLNAGITH
jgi:hypothetical protein